MKKTGQKCERSGHYLFVRYVSAPPGTKAPTANERDIPMSYDETFPPIKSTGQAAWWKWVRY